MKKIFFVLSIVFSVIVYGQAPPGYTLISARYQWLAGKFQALTIPSGGSPALQTGQTPIAGGLWYDSTAGKVYVYDGSWTQISGTAAWGAITGTLSAQTDLNTALGLKLAASDTANKWISTIFRVPGKDSIIYYKGSTRFAVKDSTGGGGATTWQDLFDNEPGGSVMTATDIVLLSNNVFKFENGAGQAQFVVDPSGVYQFGDIVGVNFHSYIDIDDANTKFSFNTGGVVPLSLGFNLPLVLSQYRSGAIVAGQQAFVVAAGDSGRYKPAVIDTTDGTMYTGYWFGGGGGGNTIYTADDAITSDRTVDLNGKLLHMAQGGNDFLSLDATAGAESSSIAATDGTSLGGLLLIGKTGGDGPGFNLTANDATNTISVYGVVADNEIEYTAAIHTFNIVDTFLIYNGAVDLLNINNVAFTTVLRATDGTQQSVLDLESTTDATFTLFAEDGVNPQISVEGNATTGIITITTANGLALSQGSTGATTVVIGTNSPATLAATGPYTWFKMIAPDATVVYVPAWK